MEKKETAEMFVCKSCNSLEIEKETLVCAINEFCNKNNVETVSIEILCLIFFNLRNYLISLAVEQKNKGN